jgi:diacylglycerol kinase family enzyme
VRITLIHNPSAGRQGAGEAAALRRLLRDCGHEVRYQSAKDERWKAALEKAADLVMVAGGDGTVARVARRMVGRGVPLALLPSGTANNIARSLGLVARPFVELVRRPESWRRMRLDVGVAAGPWGERHFLEGVGAGLFADLLATPASEALKTRKAPVESGLQRLRQVAERCEPIEIAARLDGRDISGTYLLLEALNLPYVGPNLHLAAESRPGDGQLDVVLVRESERERLVHYLAHWQENRERLAVLPTARGRRLELEWTGFALHIDDRLRPKVDAGPEEVAGLVEVRLDGDAVEFLVPA